MVYGIKKLLYGPKVVIALIVKALQGAVPSNDCKWRWDVPEIPQHNSIGSICHLRLNMK